MEQIEQLDRWFFELKYSQKYLDGLRNGEPSYYRIFAMHKELDWAISCYERHIDRLKKGINLKLEQMKIV
jgi:uncharacterized protein YdcH (DUF465 family)